MKSLKQRIAPYAITGIMALTPATAFAGSVGESVENFFLGPIKAVVSIPVQAIYTGPRHIINKTSEEGVLGGLSAVGDYFGRLGVKPLEEIGYGLVGENTGDDFSDIGSWNKWIEEYPVAKTVRNSVATAAAAGGIAAIHSSHHGIRNARGLGALITAGVEGLYQIFK